MTSFGRQCDIIVNIFGVYSSTGPFAWSRAKQSVIVRPVGSGDSKPSQRSFVIVRPQERKNTKSVSGMKPRNQRLHSRLAFNTIDEVGDQPLCCFEHPGALLRSKKLLLVVGQTLFPTPILLLFVAHRTIGKIWSPIVIWLRCPPRQRNDWTTKQWSLLCPTELWFWAHGGKRKHFQAHSPQARNWKADAHRCGITVGAGRDQIS